MEKAINDFRQIGGDDSFDLGIFFDQLSPALCVRIPGVDWIVSEQY